MTPATRTRSHSGLPPFNPARFLPQRHVLIGLSYRFYMMRLRMLPRSTPPATLLRFAILFLFLAARSARARQVLPSFGEDRAGTAGFSS